MTNVGYLLAFPFLFGGTFIEGPCEGAGELASIVFPFLFGGTFIEGPTKATSWRTRRSNFPSFSEGLSLRAMPPSAMPQWVTFPFLFGGTFIEGVQAQQAAPSASEFPFLFGGTFIEGLTTPVFLGMPPISLPFRRDFH